MKEENKINIADEKFMDQFGGTADSNGYILDLFVQNVPVFFF